MSTNYFRSHRPIASPCVSEKIISCAPGKLLAIMNASGTELIKFLRRPETQAITILDTNENNQLEKEKKKLIPYLTPWQGSSTEINQYLASIKIEKPCCCQHFTLIRQSVAHISLQKRELSS
jgi:hypothetical protein